MSELVLSPSHLQTFDIARAFGMSRLPSSEALNQTVADLLQHQGASVIVGGIAVGYHGHERATKDVDALYFAYDEYALLKRLEPLFEIIIKADSGWHELKHRQTGVCLELIPEGGLGTYGFIPSPKVLGGEGGFISLKGLIWMKLIAWRLRDQADISDLALIQFDKIMALRNELPPEFLDRFDPLMELTRKTIEAQKARATAKRNTPPGGFEKPPA